MKRIATAAALLLTASLAHADIAGAPAGNYIRNQSYRQPNAQLNISSGTIAHWYGTYLTVQNGGSLEFSYGGAAAQMYNPLSGSTHLRIDGNVGINRAPSSSYGLTLQDIEITGTCTGSGCAGSGGFGEGSTLSSATISNFHATSLTFPNGATITSEEGFPFDGVHTDTLTFKSLGFSGGGYRYDFFTYNTGAPPSMYIGQNAGTPGTDFTGNLVYGMAILYNDPGSSYYNTLMGIGLGGVSAGDQVNSASYVGEYSFSSSPNTYLMYGMGANNFRYSEGNLTENIVIGDQIANNAYTAQSNIALGVYSLYSSSTPVGNVTLGGGTLYNSTAPYHTIAIGRYAGQYDAYAYKNIWIGPYTGPSSSDTLRVQNSVGIGYGVTVDSSNVAVIGGPAGSVNAMTLHVSSIVAQAIGASSATFTSANATDAYGFRSHYSGNYGTTADILTGTLPAITINNTKSYEVANVSGIRFEHRGALSGIIYVTEGQEMSFFNGIQSIPTMSLEVVSGERTVQLYENSIQFGSTWPDRWTLGFDTTNLLLSRGSADGGMFRISGGNVQIDYGLIVGTITTPVFNVTGTSVTVNGNIALNGTCTGTGCGAGGGVVATDSPTWSGVHDWTSVLRSSFNALYVADMFVSTLTVEGIGAGVLDLTEDVAPAGISGHNLLYADSTSHWLKMINNNGTGYLVAGSSIVPTAGHKATWSGTGTLIDGGVDTPGGVTSVHASGQAAITGEVTVVAGTGISLSQSGSSITVTNTVSSGNLSGGTTNYAMCWLSATTAGHCMSAVASNGSCTCIANQSAPLSPAISTVWYSSVSVTWTQVASDLGYTLEASSTNFSGGTLYSSGTTNGASATLIVVGLSEATTYWMKVGSRWNDGTTTYANTVPTSTKTLTAGGGGSWAFVQSSSMTLVSGDSSTDSSTITVTAGNLLVVGCYSGGAGCNNAVTDTLGNTYTAVTSSSVMVNDTGTPIACLQIFYAKNISGGENKVNCANHVDWPGDVEGVVLEYSGLSTASPYDVSSSSSPIDSPANAVSNYATTTGSNEVMVSFMSKGIEGAPSGSGSGTFRDSSYRAATETWVGAQDADVPSPTSYQSSWTDTDNYYSHGMVQAAFKP